MLKIKSMKFTDDPVFKNNKFDFTTRNNYVSNAVVLVGENGSGKTRLLNILQQLTDYVFGNYHVLIQRWTIDNVISKEEIKAHNNFYLDASKYEIEYEYIFTENEKKFFEIDDLDIEDKNGYKYINSKLGDKITFKLNILTSFGNNINYLGLDSTHFYLMQIDTIELFDSNNKLIDDKDLNHKILLKFKDESLHDSPFNSRMTYILGLLAKRLQYTYFFDTLTALTVNNSTYNKNIKQLIANLIELEKENENLKSKNAKEESSKLENIGDPKINYEIYYPSLYIHKNFEEIVLEFYHKELDEITKVYYFNSISSMRLTKLDNYVKAINEFFKSTSKDDSFLEIDKIEYSKIYFNKSNQTITYGNLSVGEKKFLDESIYLFNLIENKDFTLPDTNEYNDLKNKSNNNEEYENNIKMNSSLNKAHWDNKKNISDVSLINKIYFIDELELGFHPIWIKNILNFLKTSLKNINGQIFIATHSEIIPYSINIETDTLINMNDKSSNVISFKNYNSIQDFVNKTLYVDYEDFIDEYDIWVEGRSDKVVLDLAINELAKKEFIPFNIRFANNFKGNSRNQETGKTIKELTNSFNKLINGSIGIKTQFLTWLSKNSKTNVEKLKDDKEIKPKVFIFDNDDNGKKSFNKIKKVMVRKKHNQNIEMGLSSIKINWEEIHKNDVFNGYEITRIIDQIKEKSFILIYKQEIEKINKKNQEVKEFEIEDFIKDENYKKIFNKYKGNKNEIERKLSKIDTKWKEKLSEWFKDYVLILKKILKINKK